MLVAALAVWRRPPGIDEAAGAPGPLDRVEVALAGAEQAIGGGQEALEAAMMTTSTNQQLERAELAARFEPAVASALVRQARTLAHRERGRQISRALEALYVFTCVDSFGGFRDALSALIEGDTGGARHAIESGLGGSHAAALMTCRLPVDCILSVC